MSTPSETVELFDRLVQLQNYSVDDAPSNFDVALREIETGEKQGHWIWYIWPTLKGVRTTSRPDLMIPNFDAARAYLRHPALAARILTITKAATFQLRRGVPPSVLFGSMQHVDTQKFIETCSFFYCAAHAEAEIDASWHAVQAVFGDALRAMGSTKLHGRTVDILAMQGCVISKEHDVLFLVSDLGDSVPP